MKIKLLCLLIVFSLLTIMGRSKLLAQLPTSNNGLLYFIHTNSDTIFNYDPNQALSSSNPSINSIRLPASTGYSALAVGDNLNTSSPSPTFYTDHWTYYYHNGSSWVNTGDSTADNNNSSAANTPAAGGGFIFNNAVSPGKVYKYKGTGNGSLVMSYSSPFVTSQPAVDCGGNFYLLAKNTNNDTLIYKFDSSGNQVDSFKAFAVPHQLPNVLTILGNRVFCGGGTYGLYSGLLINHTIHFNLISASGVFSNIRSISSYSVSTLNNIIASADTVWYCQGAPPAQVYGTGPGPYTWTVLSGLATITGGGDTVGLSCSGMAKVVLSSSFTSSCGNSTDTIVMMLKPSPNIPNIINNSPVCQGDSLSFSISNPQLNMSYGWTGANNFSSNLFSPVKNNMQFVDSGYYAVTATAVNGCSAKDSVMVQVKTMPQMPIAANNGPLCTGDTLKLSAVDTTSGISYSWTGPGSFSSTVQNPVRMNVVLTDAGKYRVRATLNGCSSGYDSTNVVINPVIVPNVSIASLPTVITAGHVDTFTATTNCSSATYQWYKNGTAIPGATSNSYLTLLAAGDIITVEAHCSGCADPDSAVSNSLTTVGIGTSPGLSKGEVTVWPNPVSGDLSLSLSEGEGTARVYSTIGQMVYTLAVHKGLNIIDTKHFAVGVYVLELMYIDGSKDVVRVVKE